MAERICIREGQAKLDHSRLGWSGQPLRRAGVTDGMGVSPSSPAPATSPTPQPRAASRETSIELWCGCGPICWPNASHSGKGTIRFKFCRDPSSELMLDERISIAANAR